MPKQRTTCPRCGYEKAAACAQGPNVCFCKKCGRRVSLVTGQFVEGESRVIYAYDPLRNAMKLEELDRRAQ